MTTELLPAPIASIGVEAESWLHEATTLSPDQPIVWCPHAYPLRRDGAQPGAPLCTPIPVARARRRAVLEWSRGDVRRWCQTIRYPTGWVVDAHDGTLDDFAKRVFRGSPGDYPKLSGRRPAFDFELWQPLAAADVMWTWLDGSLPEGAQGPCGT